MKRLAKTITLISTGIMMNLIIGCTKTDDVKEVSDIDGNKYNTVNIGGKLWLKENLKTTKLNDGTAIPMISNNTAWKNSTTPGFCYYDNLESNKTVYGNLYNWSAVNTGILCPKGFHVATNDDWLDLIDFLGGEAVAGGKLKETGITHWSTPNNADNSSGFTALPGGFRSTTDGSYLLLGKYSFFWTSTEDGTSRAVAQNLSYNITDIIEINSTKNMGYSCRCVED